MAIFWREYDTITLFYVDFYKKYGRTKEGKRTVNGMFYVRIQDESEGLLLYEKNCMFANEIRHNSSYT